MRVRSLLWGNFRCLTTKVAKECTKDNTKELADDKFFRFCNGDRTFTFYPIGQFREKAPEQLFKLVVFAVKYLHGPFAIGGQ